jgi:hypothetical protein
MDLLLHRFDLNLIGQQYATTLISTNQKKIHSNQTWRAWEASQEGFWEFKNGLIIHIFSFIRKNTYIFSNKIAKFENIQSQKEKAKMNTTEFLHQGTTDILIIC